MGSTTSGALASLTGHNSQRRLCVHCISFLFVVMFNHLENKICQRSGEKGDIVTTSVGGWLLTFEHTRLVLVVRLVLRASPPVLSMWPCTGNLLRWGSSIHPVERLLGAWKQTTAFREPWRSPVKSLNKQRLIIFIHWKPWNLHDEFHFYPLAPSIHKKGQSIF